MNKIMANVKGGLLKAAHENIIQHELLSGAAAMLAITLILFGDVLFFSQQMILSQLGTDLSSQFVHWRYFGFSQLKQGVLPLWNPHIFSGTPYVGGFQSAMFYPLNLLYVILPLATAINYSIAIHVFLLGFFMYLWVINRGLSQVSALFAGMFAIFCGAFFPHIYPGHLPNLCVMPWVPLLFYSMDRFSAKPTLVPLLLGVLSITMQILAGHPQYVFYTGVAAVLYLLLNLFFTRHRLATVIGFIVIYIAAALLSSIQLFTGLAAAADSVRSNVSYDFASMFSFPYENLLTLITPGFFGATGELPYWGGNYFWEMSLFISITGFVLAVYGAIHGDKKIRLTSLILFATLLVLAFGKYTPLFDMLYFMVPGFNKFRGISKFIFPASLFLILLAAVGFHTMLQQKIATKTDTVKTKKNRNKAKDQSKIITEHLTFALFPLAGGLLLLFLGGLFMLLGNDALRPFIRYILESSDSYFPREQLSNQMFLQHARINAGYQLLWAAGVSLTISLLIYLGKHRRKFLFLLPLLALVELLIFALPLRPTFNIQDVANLELKQHLKTLPGDYRILYDGDVNAAMTLGSYDVSGYDPMVIKRYAEFIAYTQGNDPDNPGQYLHIRKYHPLYKMLRFRFFIPNPTRTSAKEWIEFPGIMKRLNLIYNFAVLNDRNWIFASLSNPSFDPAQSVILETQPDIVPNIPAENARVEIVDSSVNHLTIKADLSSPAILLVTDLYAPGWQAKAMAGSVQSNYQVLPADYILKAIPLKAGYHQFRLFYQPQAFIIGAWVSGLSLFCLVVGCLLYYVLVGRKRVSGGVLRMKQ